MSFEFNTVARSLFLSATFCWDDRLFLLEIVQNVIFGGTIGYGDWYLEFLFRHFRVFRLHAIVHDAAGAVCAQSRKRPGYCYMTARQPN